MERAMVDPLAYAEPRIVQSYARRDDLLPAELAALGEVWHCVRGDVLDLGVGAGRTTRFLFGAAHAYRAVDFNPEMVSACRLRFPRVQFDVGDARDLVGHESSAYDLVFFSFNGIDYVEPEDRPRVLAEAFRVLRPGGAFVYSSHNLGALGEELSHLELPGVTMTANALTLAARVGRAGVSLARSLANRARLAGQQRRGDGWAVVNDDAHDYAMLTVYVDPRHEVQRLVEAGFSSDVTMLGLDGRVTDGNLRDVWVHYVARKPAG
jgi:SAM-dependent methyltransferase